MLLHSRLEVHHPHTITTEIQLLSAAGSGFPQPWLILQPFEPPLLGASCAKVSVLPMDPLCVF